MKLTRTALLFCLAFVPPSVWAAEITLQVGRQSVRAEIADSPQSREQGLMQRNQLCANCGMLFVFERTGRYLFWMKDTPLPLSIAFIAADGSIINIVEMQPHTTETHGAEGEALYALEMNSGWFARNGVKPHGKVRGLEHVRARLE